MRGQPGGYGRYEHFGVQCVITAPRIQFLFSLGSAGLLCSLLCDSADTGGPCANRCEFVAVTIYSSSVL